MQKFSHDQSVKNLIKAYPEEALEFLACDVIASHGPPLQCIPCDPAVAKDDTAEPGPGMAMDIAFRYLFASGNVVIIVLVEHWSDASKLDLLRTARYYVDLCRRFPADEILPIALVDDESPKGLTSHLERGAQGTIFLSFQTRIIQIPALKQADYRESLNRVALSFSPNMQGEFDRVQQVIQVARIFRQLDDMAGFRKFFAFWVIEGKLSSDRQTQLKQEISNMDMPIIMEWFEQEGMEKGMKKGMEKGMEKGIEAGLRQNAIANARKMLEEGCDWGFITRVTNLLPEDLS